jgi:hypothetical protein
VAQYSTYELGEKIANAASAAGIDPRVAVEQLRRESVNFSPYYVYGPGKSPAGAQGLAQFIPGTWARFGSGSPYDPDAAIRAYVAYMTFLLTMFGWRYDLALAAYNWGENRQTLRTALASGKSILDYSIPSETRGYVSAILSAAGSPFSTVSAGASGSTPSGGGSSTGGGGVPVFTGGDGSASPWTVSASLGGGPGGGNDDSGDGGAAVALLVLAVYYIFF